MAEERILVVEDETDQRRLVASILRSQGYLVSQAGCLKQAFEAMADSPHDVVLSDWKLPDGNGMQILAELRRGKGEDEAAESAFIMVSAYGTISRAVEAVRQGADDYLAKPFERQALLLAIERALRSRHLQDENRRLTEALDERDRLVDLMGSAPSMQLLFRQVEKLAGTNATVLLTGESGTGKELAARALHTLSKRSSAPFVAINCAAIPEGLIEAELFGVEKGAYTGAERSRKGKFEAAAGGSLFLDEIGELPLGMQPKLLRVLQEGHLTRVGSHREQATDVRVIAATNRDLAAEVAYGNFRQDLYYRLNVVPLRMPPLRERREDIPLLVDHFATRAARRHGLRRPPFPAAVKKRLLDYTWPGNVRELGNAVERLVLLAEDGQVSSTDLPEDMALAGSAANNAASGFRLPPGGMRWEDHEQDCLHQALDLAGGNRARAARLLDLPYKAFLYRLEKHRLGEG